MRWLQEAGGGCVRDGRGKYQLDQMMKQAKMIVAVLKSYRIGSSRLNTFFSFVSIITNFMQSAFSRYQQCIRLLQADFLCLICSIHTLLFSSRLLSGMYIYVSHPIKIRNDQFCYWWVYSHNCLVGSKQLIIDGRPYRDCHMCSHCHG